MEFGTRLVLLAAAVCADSAGAATIRSKADRRLWETVDDRAAPLTWPWAAEADEATLVFSNRVTKAVSSVEIARGADEARGCRAQPAPMAGEAVVDVTLVQTSSGREVARETASLAYVNGARGGPITVRSRTARDWTQFVTPRVYGVDPVWLGLDGESGYDVAWPMCRPFRVILR